MFWSSPGASGIEVYVTILWSPHDLRTPWKKGSRQVSLGSIRLVLLLSLSGIFMENHEAYARHLVHHLCVLGPPLFVSRKLSSFSTNSLFSNRSCIVNEDTELGAWRSEFANHRELRGASNFLLRKWGLERNGGRECSPIYNLAESILFSLDSTWLS